MATKRKRRRKPATPATAPATPVDSAHGVPRRSVKDASRARPGSSTARALDNTLLALVSAGIVLTAYLTFTAWFGEHPAFCGTGSACDLVQASRWSKLLGVPMSLWGLLTYAVLARSIWRLRQRPSAWRFAILVAFVGAGVSWFLTIVSIVQIEATCMYCLASFVVMNALLVLLLMRRPAHLPEHRWSKALPTPAAVAIAVVLGLQLHFSGLFDPAAGPEDPYLKELAIHLAESGAKFYGAYWCPHCQEQKALFEASVDRLPYVECSPDGRNGAESLACRDADVADYPTWIIGTSRKTGVLAAKELARLSGFRKP